jgi:hypothetical protein
MRAELFERFLILARTGNESTESLQSVLAPFGPVEIVVDQSPGDADARTSRTKRGDGQPSEIHIPDCEARGFRGMMSDSSPFPGITAWSRAFAHLATNLNDGESFWFVEDDVAGDAASFKKLIEGTIRRNPDLAAIDIRTKESDPGWWWWDYAEGIFPEPAAAFQPLCRLSSSLVRRVLDFQKKLRQLMFHEILFASLAKEAGMRCLSWDRSAEFQHLFPSFRYRPEVNAPICGISHPVKDAALHSEICSLEPAEFPRRHLAPCDGWSIFPDDYEFLVRFCRKHGIRRVAEFGPGDSTMAFLDAGCRVVSFEHDAAWLRHVVRRFHDDPCVELSHLPEGDLPDTSQLGFVPDLVFVDGPPARAEHEKPRLAPCEWALATCGAFLLHDSNREGERRTLSQFEQKGMLIAEIPTEKGMVLVVDPGRRPEFVGWSAQTLDILAASDPITSKRCP